jgi:beta-lactamase class A
MPTPSEIEQNLKLAVAAVQGKVSYLIIDQLTQRSWEHRAKESFRAASLIKIPILYCFFRELEESRFTLEQGFSLSSDSIVPGTGILKDRKPGTFVSWKEAARLMIVESDNVATNALIDKLGFDSINHSIRQLGLKSTVIQRRMQDFGAAAMGFENLTTAEDIAAVLSQVARERSSSVLEKSVYEHLVMQNLRSKLPYFLPAHIKCAHKTGDIPQLEHDAGILTDAEKDLVVVALSDQLLDNADGVNYCRQIGRIAAQIFTTDFPD